MENQNNKPKKFSSFFNNNIDEVQSRRSMEAMKSKVDLLERNLKIVIDEVNKLKTEMERNRRD